jgi:hypothetical protein
MPKRPAPERLDLDQLGDLENYYDDELADVREKLIADVARIEDENRQADARIKAFNVRKQELNQQRAERARAIRAVKHELSQRMRVDTPMRRRAAR